MATFIEDVLDPTQYSFLLLSVSDTKWDKDAQKEVPRTIWGTDDPAVALEVSVQRRDGTGRSRIVEVEVPKAAVHGEPQRGAEITFAELTMRARVDWAFYVAGAAGPVGKTSASTP